MRRIIAGCILLLPISVLHAQSPIVITNAQMPGMNDTLRYTNVQIGSIADYLSTGEDHVWDFSGVASGAEGIRSFQIASATPYPFYFFGSNEYGEKVAATVGAGPFTITDYYNFYKKQAAPQSAFVADGVGLTFSSIPMPAYFSDRDELYVFPLTYGNRDSTTFRFATLTSSMLPARYSKTGHRVTEVDGWGTITTPFGTENCIRLVTTQYSRDTVKATLLPFPLGFQNNVRSYQWLTLGSKIPYLEITGAFQMENFTPTTARYRGYVNGNRTGLGEFAREKPHVYPSPAVNDLFVKGVSIDGTIRISNIAGALVREVSSSDGHVDVSGLHPGIYFIQLRSGSGIVHHRFVKE